MGRRSHYIADIIDKEKVVKLALSGVDIKEIAKVFEAHPQYIRQILRKYPDVRWEKIRERKRGVK